MAIPHARTVLAAAGLLALAIAMTGAAVVSTAEYRITFAGADNRFDYVAAASDDPTWTPSSTDWIDASAEPIVLDLSDAEALEPGEHVDFVVAVKNAGPLAGDLTLRIDDPDRAGGDNVDPTFFEQLVFTVSSETTTLLDDRISSFEHTWPSFAPGESRTFDVRITLPADLEDQWLDESTQIRVQFEGMNL